MVNDNNIERSKKHLVAYYVSKNNEEIDKDLLVDYLAEKLPMHDSESMEPMEIMSSNSPRSRE